MKRLKILFQGDSITDGGRDRRNYHHLGATYPKYAAAAITTALPDVEFEFINLGISGNRTCQLFDRSTADIIDIAPDVVTLLIGINDIWHRYSKSAIPTTDAQIELNLRCLLTEIKARTNAKIVMLSPYLLDHPNVQHMRPEFERLLAIIDKLAAEFADVYLPTEKLFEEALPTQPEPCYYSNDGVHPNHNGSVFIGEALAKALLPLLQAI